MTQNDIDSGALIVVIGVAAVRPAEFVTITLRQLARTCPA
jgi:phage tail sheath protein FI